MALATGLPSGILAVCLMAVFGSVLTSAQTTCPDDYTAIEGSCFHFAGSYQYTVSEAETYCAELGGGLLAVLDDCSLFGSVVNYIESVEERNRFSYWIGATDIEVEGTWVWVNGESVTLGSPFWGEVDGAHEPDVSVYNNCALLEHSNRHQMHSVGCTALVAPLCQTDPLA